MLLLFFLLHTMKIMIEIILQEIKRSKKRRKIIIIMRIIKIHFYKNSIAHDFDFLGDMFMKYPRTPKSHQCRKAAFYSKTAEITMYGLLQRTVTCSSCFMLHACVTHFTGLEMKKHRIPERFFLISNNNVL